MWTTGVPRWVGAAEPAPTRSHRLDRRLCVARADPTPLIPLAPRAQPPARLPHLSATEAGMWVRRWGRRADAVVRELHPASTSSPSWSCTGAGDTSAGNEAIPVEGAGGPGCPSCAGVTPPDRGDSLCSQLCPSWGWVSPCTGTGVLGHVPSHRAPAGPRDPPARPGGSASLVQHSRGWKSCRNARRRNDLHPWGAGQGFWTRGGVLGAGGCRFPRAVLPPAGTGGARTPGAAPERRLGRVPLPGPPPRSPRLDPHCGPHPEPPLGVGRSRRDGLRAGPDPGAGRARHGAQVPAWHRARRQRPVLSILLSPNSPGARSSCGCPSRGRTRCVEAVPGAVPEVGGGPGAGPRSSAASPAMPFPAALLFLALLLPPPPLSCAAESESETGARELRLETIVSPGGGTGEPGLRGRHRGPTRRLGQGAETGAIPGRDRQGTGGSGGTRGTPGWCCSGGTGEPGLGTGRGRRQREARDAERGSHGAPGGPGCDGRAPGGPGCGGGTRHTEDRGPGWELGSRSARGTRGHGGCVDPEARGPRPGSP